MTSCNLLTNEIFVVLRNWTNEDNPELVVVFSNYNDANDFCNQRNELQGEGDGWYYSFEGVLFQDTLSQDILNNVDEF